MFSLLRVGSPAIVNVMECHDIQNEMIINTKECPEIDTLIDTHKDIFKDICKLQKY